MTRQLLALSLWLLVACDPEVVVGHRGTADEEEPLPVVSWPSGAYAGHDLAPNLAFAAWRGRPLDVVTLFVDRTSWSGIVSPGWPVDMYTSFPGTLILSVPLYPEGQGDNRTCASGAYDGEWRKLGAFLVQRGRPDSILRLGWGPNDLDHAWRADADPADWIACFQRIVTAVRESDPRARIDWSFNPKGPSQIADWDPYATYPGDAFVDFVGIEAFDRHPPALSDAEWARQCEAPTGLCSLARFARQHGKKLGIAEWGVAACGAGAGGDNPRFVRRIVAQFAANRDIMGFESYFESEDDDVCSALTTGLRNREAAAVYRAIYAAR